jgi:hypothetical protein
MKTGNVTEQEGTRYGILFKTGNVSTGRNKIFMKTGNVTVQEGTRYIMKTGNVTEQEGTRYL